MTALKRSTRVIDIANQKFNRLTVLRVDGVHRKKVKWLCLCDCGKETIVDSYRIRNGLTKSCGCLNSELSRERGQESVVAAQQARVTHGYSRKGNIHPLWNVWYAMKQRCYRKESDAYRFYGARSIQVCSEWMDSGTFIEWSLSNGWESGLQIDRINNDEDYSPSNCRFVTPKENSRNRRNNRLISYQDRMMTIAELSELTGIEQSKIISRLKNNWPIEDVVNPNRIRHWYRKPKMVSLSIDLEEKVVQSADPVADNEVMPDKDSLDDNGHAKAPTRGRSVSDGEGA